MREVLVCWDEIDFSFLIIVNVIILLVAFGSNKLSEFIVCEVGEERWLWEWWIVDVDLWEYSNAVYVVEGDSKIEVTEEEYLIWFLHFLSLELRHAFTLEAPRVDAIDLAYPITESPWSMLQMRVDEAHLRAVDSHFYRNNAFTNSRQVFVLHRADRFESSTTSENHSQRLIACVEIHFHELTARYVHILLSMISTHYAKLKEGGEGSSLHRAHSVPLLTWMREIQ